MFDALGLLLAGYVCYAVLVGQVWAKAGPLGRIVCRELSPEYFWTVIAIYAGLSVALVLLF